MEDATEVDGRSSVSTPDLSWNWDPVKDPCASLPMEAQPKVHILRNKGGQEIFS